MPRTIAGFVTCLLLAITLAGCAGGDGSADEGAIGTVTLPTGEVISADAGVVTGTVISDTGSPLPDAAVFLAGTSFRQSTGADGGFRFVNVTADTYILRVEASNFRVFEETVDVLAGQIVHRNVTMLPADSRGAGYRPHIHDYWGEQTEITIMDESVDLRELDGDAFLFTFGGAWDQYVAPIYWANVRNGEYRIPLPEDVEPPALVYPGAERVEVTFRWDDSPPMPPTYALWYAPANDNSFVELEEHGTDEPWTIDVLPGMADNGHQTVSLWEFLLVTGNDAREAPDYRPAAVTETIQVTIKVYKGDEVPLEPPHPEFWSEGDELLLRDHGDNPIEREINCVFCGHPVMYLRDGAIVPPGTGKLLVELDWSYSQADGSALDQDYELYWNTGQYDPDDRPRSEWDTSTATSKDGSFKTWEIEVEKADTDAFYQKKSMWRFGIVQSGSDPDGYPLPDHFRAREFTLKVTAVRAAGASIF